MNLRIKNIGILLLTGGLLSLAVAPQTRAQAVYTYGHGDLGIEYEAGDTGFEPHWHLHAGSLVNGVAVTDPDGEEFAPGDLVAHASATFSAPSGSSVWLGVSEGNTVWRLGNEIYQPELGFGLEELTDTDWLDSTITLSLTGWGVDNAGQVAILSGTAPGFDVLASTFDFTNDNTWVYGAGDHVHPVWLFSDAGTYDLEFTWSGTYIGDGGSTPVSGTATFSFAVAAVPEPATYAALFGALALGLAFWRRRRNAA